jgi:hypothetical protein
MNDGDIVDSSVGTGEPPADGGNALCQDFRNLSPDRLSEILLDMQPSTQSSTANDSLGGFELVDSAQPNRANQSNGIESWDLENNGNGKAYFPDDVNAINPNWKEIAQGAIGDCFFVAAMQAVAKQEYGPDHLRSMIKRIDGPGVNDQSAEDVFEVTFPGQLPIQVSYRELHPYGASQTDGDSGLRDGLAGRWPSILEAAAGKIAALRDPHANYQYPAEALEKIADPKWALDLLTGQNSTDSQFLNYRMNGAQARDWTEAYDRGGANSLIAGSKMLWTVLFNRRSSAEVDALLQDAAANDAMIVLGKDNHAYTMMEYQHGETAAQSTVLLRNPWGFKNAETLHTDRNFKDGKPDGLLQLPVSEIHRMFDVAFIAPGTLVEFPFEE